MGGRVPASWRAEGSVAGGLGAVPAAPGLVPRGPLALSAEIAGSPVYPPSARNGVA